LTGLQQESRKTPPPAEGFFSGTEKVVYLRQGTFTESWIATNTNWARLIQEIYYGGDKGYSPEGKRTYLLWLLTEIWTLKNSSALHERFPETKLRYS
jgi:hypothetical protein